MLFWKLLRGKLLSLDDFVVPFWQTLAAAGGSRTSSGGSIFGDAASNLFNVQQIKKGGEAKKRAIAANLLYDPGGTFSTIWNMGGGGDGDSDGEDYINVTLPEYYIDPYYEKSQAGLYDVGSSILTGDLSDYYAPIGEAGSQEFEDVLSLGIRDIEQAGAESAARYGIRGARAAGEIARQVSDYTRKARYDDWARAVQGKEFLLGTGLNTISNVSQGALNQSQIRNNFGLNRSRLDMAIQLANAGAEDAAASALGNTIGSAINTAANLYSAYQYGSANQGRNQPASNAFQVDYGNNDLGNMDTNFDFSDYYTYY